MTTDTTWRSGDGYTFPSPLTGGYPTSQSEIASPPADFKGSIADYQEYAINMSADYSKNLSNV